MPYKKNMPLNGFTLIEILISLVLLAIMMTAVAVCFDASSKNYQENEKILDTLTAARQAITRMTTQLRTADTVAMTDPNGQCSLIDSGGTDISFMLDEDSNILYLVTNDDDTDRDYVLCRNVSNLVFVKQTGFDSLGQPCVKSVRISLTVSSGNVSRQFASAAVIRKNL